MEHIIDVQGHPPIKQKQYLSSPKVEQHMREEADQMIANDVIEPVKGSWRSPALMIKKPDGTYRFCLDLRGVNKVTKKDVYPIPNMNAILRKLRAAKYISKIDLRKGFLQIPLHPDSREITGFIVPGRGLYQFKRMPFGLTNAPATFQRLLDGVIKDSMEPYCFVYLDDIIIVTQTFEEHLEWLKIVLLRLTKFGLQISLEKSEFCTSQVHYLGFLVNKRGF